MQLYFLTDWTDLHSTEQYFPLPLFIIEGLIYVFLPHSSQALYFAKPAFHGFCPFLNSVLEAGRIPLLAIPLHSLEQYLPLQFLDF